jgi:hypothetical protein
MASTLRPLGDWPTIECRQCGGLFSDIGPRFGKDRGLCDACNLPPMWGDDETDGRAYARAVIDAFTMEE